MSPLGALTQSEGHSVGVGARSSFSQEREPASSLVRSEGGPLKVEAEVSYPLGQLWWFSR